MPPKAKAKTVDGKKTMGQVLAELRAGNAKIGTADDIQFGKIVGMTTGNIVLDYLTDIGGYPKGRITEQFGPPSSGKTTSALQAMAIEQQKCIQADEGYVMYLDFEHALDLDYCQKLGIDVHHHSFILMQPFTFEEGANAFREALKTGELRMGVFDSVAAMVTEKEIEDATGKSSVADRAKMLHQFCRQIRGHISMYQVTTVFINHTMEKVDITFMGQQMAARGMKQYTQPGGKALPFYSSMRIEFKPTTQVKGNEFDTVVNADGKQANAINVVAKIVKNKVGRPFREAELRIRFGKGFSQEYSILSVLESYKVIKKSGSWYNFPTELSIPQLQGEDAVLTYMETHPQETEKLKIMAQEILNSTKPEEDVFMGESVEDVSDSYDVDPTTGEVLE